MAGQKKRAMAGPDRSSKRRKVGFEIALLVRLRYIYTSYSCFYVGIHWFSVSLSSTNTLLTCYREAINGTSSRPKRKSPSNPVILASL